MPLILYHYEIGIQLFVGMVLPPFSIGPLRSLSQNILPAVPWETRKPLEARAVEWNLLIVTDPFFSERNGHVRI
jgi:hypothetical protein